MRKLSLLTVLTMAVIETACSGAMSSPNGATPAPAPATGPPTTIVTPGPEQQPLFTTTTGQEVQHLFDTVLKALRSGDAALLRSTMPR